MSLDSKTNRMRNHQHEVCFDQENNKVKWFQQEVENVLLSKPQTHEARTIDGNKRKRGG